MGSFDGWQVLYSMSVGIEPLQTGSLLDSFQDFLRTFSREDTGAQQSYSNHPEQARNCRLDTLWKGNDTCIVMTLLTTAALIAYFSAQVKIPRAAPNAGGELCDDNAW